MDELVKTFHIDAGLLLAQMVNFTIVLLVLYKFAYKPVLKVLNSRTRKIEKGLRDAEEARKKIEEAAQKEKDILGQAKLEAQAIIQKAEEAAKRNSEEIAANVRLRNEKMIKEAKGQMEEEKKKIIREAKEELAGIIVGAAGKLIGENMEEQKDSRIIREALES